MALYEDMDGVMDKGEEVSRKMALYEDMDEVMDEGEEVRGKMALYEEMDEAFPNSKFILTNRDVDDWYKSCLNHFYEDTTPIRDYIYGNGAPKDNEKIFKEVYINHRHQVMDYFKNRHNDFLVIDFTKGEGWEKLCPFLGVEILSEPIPHANKGLYTKRPNSLKKKLWLFYKKIYGFLYHKFYKPLFK